MILETDPAVIAGKVATHTMDADAPLSEQVMQTFCLMGLQLKPNKLRAC